MDSAGHVASERSKKYPIFLQLQTETFRLQHKISNTLLRFKKKKKKSYISDVTPYTHLKMYRVKENNVP